MATSPFASSDRQTLGRPDARIGLALAREEESVVVKFAKPSTQICIQVLPDAWFSCMPLLLSMDELLTTIGDKALNGPVHEFMRVAGSVGERK